MAAKLGSLLLKAGVINQQQLEEALQAQVMFGGRIGTNLIELGFISEEYLARFLGKQFNIPFCPTEDLKNIPKKTLTLVPKKLVEKFQAIPLRQRGKQLWVAMVDPTFIKAIDEMTFATGFKIHPMIAPEIQVADAMERYYKIEKEPRYIQLSQGDPREKMKVSYSTKEFVDDILIPGDQKNRPAPPNTPPKVSAPIEKTPPPALESLPEKDPEQNFLSAPENEDPLDLNEPDELFPLSDMAEILTEAKSKEDIFKAIQSPFMEFFDRYALFINKNDFMVGLEGHGNSFHNGQIDTIAIPLRVPSVFRDAVRSRKPLFGPLPNGHNNQSIAKMLHIDHPDKPCLFCPLPLVQKVGVMIFADHCKDTEAVKKRLGKFEKLMEKAGLSFQVLVLKQKILHL